MANWGLLGGLGAGLSQFGSTLSQGLNADIAAKQREDIETRREASIEKRWLAQQDRAKKQDKIQSERWSKQDKRQAERDKVSDSQFNRTATSRENSVIESNISGIMQSKQKAMEDLDKRFQKMAVDPMGNPLQGDALTELNKRMKFEAKKVNDRYSEILDTRVKSYGERLRGTGFSYLLDVPDIEEVVKDPTGKVESEKVDPGKGGSTIRDFAERILAGGGGTDLEAELLKKMPYPESMDSIKRPTNKNLDATFMNAFKSAIGGYYGADDRAPMREDTTPIEDYTTMMGRNIGTIPGLLGDGGQIVNDKAIQPAWDWANTRSTKR